MQCSICLNENKKYRNLTCSCGHTFHKKCINRWLNSNNDCPLCKRIIKKEEVPDSAEMLTICLNQLRDIRQHYIELAELYAP